MKHNMYISLVQVIKTVEMRSLVVNGGTIRLHGVEAKGQKGAKQT